MTAPAELETAPEVVSRPGFGIPTRVVIGGLAIVGGLFLGHQGTEIGLSAYHNVTFVQPLEEARDCIKGPDGTLSVNCSRVIETAIDRTGLERPVANPETRYDKKGGNLQEQAQAPPPVDLADLRAKIDQDLPVARAGLEDFKRNGKFGAGGLLGGIFLLSAGRRRGWF